VAGAAGTAGDASALGGRAPSSYLPGPFVRATLINGWQQLPDGQIPGYWAGPGPVASVKGSIKSGATATVAFTLPPGVRPRRSVTERIDCPGDGTPGKVSISLTGGVVISDVGGSICGGATGFALIPTVTFRTDN
jgi:hypothetical protein